jgi:ABC-type proline/glycine betaine transport system ATPase subunit
MKTCFSTSFLGGYSYIHVNLHPHPHPFLSLLIHIHVSLVVGSGKTSLLDVLVGRASDGEILGDIYLNSVTQNNSMIRSFSAYVKQDDRLLPHLTIKETLMFVAELKLPTNFTDKQIQDRVSCTVIRMNMYIYIYIRLKIKPNSVRIRF